MSKLEPKAFRSTVSTPAITSAPILDREPLGVARSVLLSAKKHGPSILYVDGRGRMTIRKSGVVYADDLPPIWLVGAYTANASTVRIMEDLEMRLAEVRAAHG